MRGWQGQPRKMVEYEHWRKEKRSCRSSGCRLQVGDAENGLLAIRLQNFKTLFSVAGASNLRCFAVLKSKDAMRVSFFFLNEAVRNSALALH
jgi:hypothetical protein